MQLYDYSRHSCNSRRKTWDPFHEILKLTAPLKLKKEQFPVGIDGASAALRWRKVARRTPQGRGVQGWRRQDVCSGPVRKGHLPEPKVPRQRREDQPGKSHRELSFHLKLEAT